MYKLIPSLLFCLLAARLSAQPRFNFQEIQSKYPDRDIYYLTDKADLNISINNGKLDIVSNVSSDFVLLNEKATLYTERSIYYYDETEEVTGLKPMTYVPQNKGFKKMEVEKIYTRKPTRGSVFYDDMKEIYFNFPALTKGAVASCSYTQKYKDAHFIDPFFFGNYFATGQSEYTVTFPKEVSIKYVMKGDTSGIHFSQKTSGNKTTYTWSATNLRAFNDERDEGNWRRYSPHVIVYIDKYKINNKETPVLSDLKALHDWYYTHIRDLEAANPDNVKALADSLTKGITGETEKIKAIYYWVQDNIKYIAFEEGLGGFIPRTASMVCNRRFGDCKDKSSLLYALLKAAGIKSYFTWIGTRDIPYSYSEVPTPITDNHMIIAMPGSHIASVRQMAEEDWLFLDGTAIGLNLGYPSDFIQDKEALISISADSFVIAKVPVIRKELNYRSDSIRFRIDGDSVIASGTTAFGGLWKTELMSSFSDVSENKRDEEMKKMFEFGNNKSKVDTINYSGLDDYRDTLLFNYKFSVPYYVRKVDQKLFVNMNLRKSLQGDVIEPDKRKTEERYRFKYTNRQLVEMVIPSGYSLSKAPESSSFKGKSFSFTINYRKEKNKIAMESIIYIDELVKTRSEFEEWNKMIEALNDSYSQVVVLQKL